MNRSSGRMALRSLFAGALAALPLALAPASVSAEPISLPPASMDILVTNLDRSVDPGADFFQFANGAWLASHPIPAAEAGWGIGNLVDEELYVKLRTINESAAKDSPPPGSDRQKIGDFWIAAMDVPRANAAGLSPLKSELAAIDAIKTLADVLDVSFRFREIEVETFCDISVDQDEKASDLMSVHISQGGLGLPDRDFYFNPEAGIAHIRKEYVAHVTRMLKLLGRSEADAAKRADQIMAFETALAKVSRKLEDLRDPEKNYNKMAPARLTTGYTPLIDWDQRLAALSLPATNVIVGQPEFFKGLNRLLKKTPVPLLQDYLRLELVSSYAECLDEKWEAEDFAFHGKVLSGQQEQRPRWKRVLDAQGGTMGMLLGKIFVADYFPPATKARYVGLVEAIRGAYHERIERLDWMSPETKAKAQAKLAKITAKVGYPDKWKDYSTMVISTNSYCENMLNASRWHFHDMVSKFGKPVDRTEWDMTPQTYNAYYNPANNEIVLPAAIFTVPGVKDTDLDDAVIYGYAAASTIGHEITHGFDDEGRQFDPAGNLHDWWTPADAKSFQKRTKVMVAQFNAYEPIPGLHINGAASLGENLADYGGLLLGLDAFKKTAQYQAGQPIAGLSPLQRYFLGYALGWLYQDRIEHLRDHLLSDVHAPAKWRVNGPLANIPDFHTAFGVKPGQPMYRPADQQVKVW